MSHDPLCPCFGEVDELENCHSHSWCKCDCAVITKVRADEKAKWTHTCPDNNCCHGSPE